MTSCIKAAAGLYVESKGAHMRRFSAELTGCRSSFCVKRVKARGAFCARKLLHRLHVTSLLLAFLLSCFVLVLQSDHHLPSALDSPFVFMDALHDAIHELRTAGAVECDYSEGAWVPTRRRPLYSGRDCQRWLSPMWACRLNANRSSFLYESLRWQPLSCSLPRFDASSFLYRMRNKTIAFVGDSLGRQQFQSLMCLLTFGKDDNDNVLDVGAKFGFASYVKANKLNNTKTIRPSSWAYLFRKTNTTIIFSWSPTLCHLEPLPIEESNLNNSLSTLANQNRQSSNSITNQEPEVAFHVDLPPAFLSSNLNKIDVLILNTGPHWSLNKFSKNKWKVHVSNKPLTMNMTMESLSNLYNHTIHHLIDWLNKQVEIGATMAKIFYRTLSPSHFFFGDWNSGGRCDNTHFRFVNSISMRNLSKPFYADVLTQNIGHVRLLNVTWMSQLRDEAHISNYFLKAKNGSQDCLHWCLPGVPDTWNEIFYAQLLQNTLIKS